MKATIKNINRVGLLLILGMGIQQQSIAQSSSQNYIRTRTYTTNGANGARDSLDVIQYFDGLGRPIEAVQKGITPSKADLVTYQEYDAFGRESKSWLPARAANNNGAFVNFTNFQAKSSATYGNTTYNAVADAAPYSCLVYEPSPLNRVTQQFGPGMNWHNNDKPVHTSYLTNTASFCPKYTVSDDGTNATITRSGCYAAGELYVTEIKDEEGNTSYEAKDKLGQTVYIRQVNGADTQQTCYAYDSFGNLRAILSPLAVDKFTSGAWTENTQLFKDYVYANKYDSRNRCIAKKIPGADWVYYIYDKADRLIFTQDGEQRKTGEWSFSIPDVFGRIVLSGFCKNTLSYTGSPLAGIVVKAERVNATNTYKGYTLSGITLTSAKVLAVNYYDNYDFMGYNGIPTKTDNDFKYETVSGYGQQYAGTQGYEHKGLVTGSLVAYNRALYSIATLDTATVVTKTATTPADKAKFYEEADNKSITGDTRTEGEVTPFDPAWAYLASVMYYDYKGQLIQSKSQNHLGGVEKEYIAYNFTGQPIQRKLIHSASGKATQTEVYTCTYDHAGRLTQTKHKLNTGSEMVLAANTYDELGRLKSTKSNNQSKLETNFRYNIRSWTDRIVNELFDELLSYTYNGNISSINWFQDRYRQTYYFSYDKLSRISSASFSGLKGENFGVSYTYDKHGNITGISRYGLAIPALGTHAWIDKLTMIYENSNQLRNINDTGESVLSNPSDFKDYKKGATVEYTYNTNGAMTQDLNKGISSIRYNRQNLPEQVDIKNPVAEARNEYTYTITGAKLKVVHRWNPAYSNSPVIGTAINANSLTEKVTIDYAGNKIYKNGALEKILTDNGYYENGKYYFYVRDHLGNNRIVADQTGNIVQSTQYYPFGMVLKETGREKQAFKFGNKELDIMNGLNLYDFWARNYDPATGRFLTIDPMAEKYPWISPYAYCLNNPVLFIDPDGMSTHLNRLGYIVQENDDDDNSVYYHYDLSNWDSQSTLNKSGDGINYIGDLGGSINIDDIYTNLLNQNISIAKSIWLPATFRNLVKTNGEWDLKNNKNTIYGKGNDGKTIFVFKGEKMESQDVGNHHFGAVSKATGLFSEKFILKQAGEYQIKSGTSRPEWQTYKEETRTIVSPTGAVLITKVQVIQTPYGDDPRDQKWIVSGFNYYKKSKK
ncbi:MAG: DUF6443 domain-containing protein [Dysgonamonadaceae bacterium]|jgi:RHS repeat-associated protein|nr:DUF6443 domain-containing protein [Dysgonamonadaceae bacterium]